MALSVTRVGARRVAAKLVREGQWRLVVATGEVENAERRKFEPDVEKNRTEEPDEGLPRTLTANYHVLARGCRDSARRELRRPPKTS
jgi:hypothetical protein